MIVLYQSQSLFRIIFKFPASLFIFILYIVCDLLSTNVI